MATRTNRQGLEGYNSFGSLMQIKEYRSSIDIDIYFPEYDWIAYNREYSDFKKGHVKCPFEPRFETVGFIGEGPYKMSPEYKYIYTTWINMLNRCYKNNDSKDRTYEDCYVCDEWHNYQNFAQWYEEHYYSIPEESMHIDKDILYKGNKIYSPDTCCIVPRSINNLFTLRDSERNHLIGTFLSPSKKKWGARITLSNKRKTIGYYDTEEDAFNAYKDYKEYHIKELADKYIEYIPDELYQSLYSYVVEKSD